MTNQASEMESETPIEKMTKLPEIDSQASEDRISEGDLQSIDIEPEKELAARRKFDKFLVPVSLVFIFLSALDRNNVSKICLVFCPSFLA